MTNRIPCARWPEMLPDLLLHFVIRAQFERFARSNPADDIEVDDSSVIPFHISNGTRQPLELSMENVHETEINIRGSSMALNMC